MLHQQLAWRLYSAELGVTPDTDTNNIQILSTAI